MLMFGHFLGRFSHEYCVGGHGSAQFVQFSLRFMSNPLSVSRCFTLTVLQQIHGELVIQVN